MFLNKKSTWNAGAVLLAIIPAMMAGSKAKADFIFGELTNLGPTVNSAYTDYGACLSPDGLELYFSSNRPGGRGGYDVWVTKRAGVEDPWGPPVNLPPQVINRMGWDAPGSMSADGLVLYLQVGLNLSTTTRATRDAPWGPAVSVGPVINNAFNTMPVISADGLELFFSSGRSLTGGGLWVSTRATSSDPWGTPVSLGPSVNSLGPDSPTWISPDGLTLFFCSNRLGGFGGIDAWMMVRPSKESAWGLQRNLGPSINTPYTDCITAVSPDGLWCYVSEYMGANEHAGARPGGLGKGDIWQAPIVPVVDFNGDTAVDLMDLEMLIDHWGASETLCDIGPMPWGDGKVDIKDLAVFMTYYEKEKSTP